MKNFNFNSNQQSDCAYGCLYTNKNLNNEKISQELKKEFASFKKNMLEEFQVQFFFLKSFF